MAAYSGDPARTHEAFLAQFYLYGQQNVAPPPSSGPANR